MSIRRRLISILLFSILCALTSKSVIAQSNYQESSLEDIMSVQIDTVTKTLIDAAQAPSPVTVITRKQIERSAASSIPELLRQVAGVNVRWNAMMQTIDIRGFGQNPFTNRVLLLIDGTPYNSWNKGGFPQQPGLDFFPVENVKQIEIVKGPGSALYGENAYWGIINIKSLSGDDLDQSFVDVKSGERNTVSVSAMHGKSLENGSYLLSAKRLRSQLPTKFWVLNDSDVNSTDLFGKLTYNDFTFSVYHHEDEVDGFDEPIVDIDLGTLLLTGNRFISAETIEQQISIFALNYEKELEDRDLRFSADLSFAKRDGSHCASCHDAFSTHEHEDGHSGTFSEPDDHGSQTVGEFLVEWNGWNGHRIVAGIERRRVDTADHSHELTQEHVPSYTKSGIYIQDQVTLSKNIELTAGARYDTSTSPDLFDSRLSPRLALVYRPSKRFTLRTGWNKAFHYPDFSTLYQDTNFFIVQSDDLPPIPAFAGGFSMLRFVPNPDLEPEEITNIDLGFEYLINSRWHAKLDLYRSKIKDFHVNVATLQGPPSAWVGMHYQNHPDDAIIFGADLELTLKLSPRFQGYLNYAYQDNEQDGELVDSAGRLFEFVYSPQHKFNAGFHIGPFRGLSGTVELSWKDSVSYPILWNQIRQSSYPGEPYRDLESSTLINTRLFYDLPLGDSDDQTLGFSLEVKDLLDEAPIETASGSNLNLPGREVFAGIEYKVRYK